MSIRKPKEQEVELIKYIIIKSGKMLDKGFEENLLVKNLNDGGMGSLELYPLGSDETIRKFGEELDSIQFQDKDGIDVIATIYLDSDNKLYELDIWKVDYSALLSYPKIEELPNQKPLF